MVQRVRDLVLSFYVKHLHASVFPLCMTLLQRQAGAENGLSLGMAVCATARWAVRVVRMGLRSSGGEMCVIEQLWEESALATQRDLWIGFLLYATVRSSSLRITFMGPGRFVGCQ